mgnify:CR=1 FL=1
MTIPFSTFNHSGDFYARGLGHALRTYRLPDYDQALSNEPAIYEKMRRDPVIAFSLRYRKLLAAGEDWSIEPASPRPEDKELAAVIEGMLRNVKFFGNSLYNLAEAVVAGSRWAGIEGEKKTLRLGSKGQAYEWWIATALKDIDKRRFRQMPKPDAAGSQNDSGRGEDREWEWQIYEPLKMDWKAIQRHHFIRHVYDNNEGSLGYGNGLASELYAFFYSKTAVLRDGLQFIERWSSGILSAAVDSLRDGQASTLASTRATNWLNELEKMRSRHVLVFDKNDEIKVLEPPKGGWEAAKDCLAYLDGAMRVLILGASLPTEAEVEGGSFAMAKVQQSSTAAIVAHDRALLEEVITEDVIKNCLWRLNYPTLSHIGLADASPPVFRIRDSKKSDPSVQADLLLKAKQAGLRIKINEAYAKLGYEVPNVGDECLEPDVVPQQAAPGVIPNGLPGNQEDRIADSLPLGQAQIQDPNAMNPNAQPGQSGIPQ